MKNVLVYAAVAALAGLAAAPAHAGTVTVEVDGTDAIWLAGRTDVTVPPLGSPFILARHNFVRFDFELETFPSFVNVAGGDDVYVVDPAVGGIDFFNGTGNFFGPEGAAPSSTLSALGGISGYQGTQGALVGVFLDDAIPASGGASIPVLNFQGAGARDFTVLNPLLGQVFFIGDGVTSGGTNQRFVAPTGATRLFFGIPDGFSFVGAPGAYEDNDGSYLIRVGINEIPAVPVPPAAGLGLGLLGLLYVGRTASRRRRG